MRYKTIDVTGMTKGDVMRIAYNQDETKLANVDCALPQDIAEKLDYRTFFYVMDYNGNNSIFGKLLDLRNVANNNGIDLFVSYGLTIE